MATGERNKRMNACEQPAGVEICSVALLMAYDSLRNILGATQLRLVLYASR